MHLRKKWLAGSMEVVEPLRGGAEWKLGHWEYALEGDIGTQLFSASWLP
jgi:hypothetical protein